LMVKADAIRTAEYSCEHCGKNILKCDRCGNYLEAHDWFCKDGDEIECLNLEEDKDRLGALSIKTGKSWKKKFHVVPKCRMKKMKR
jgi:hypothetical protein